MAKKSGRRTPGARTAKTAQQSPGRFPSTDLTNHNGRRPPGQQASYFDNSVLVGKEAQPIMVVRPVCRERVDHLLSSGSFEDEGLAVSNSSLFARFSSLELEKSTRGVGVINLRQKGDLLQKGCPLSSFLLSFAINRYVPILPAAHRRLIPIVFISYLPLHLAHVHDDIMARAVSEP